ncbi:GNAT family N-acetyltransferase [Halpernia frigidisoli]|uniref:Acetyltransferase (GNAT) family protein n=1 Tax=Halpernia frigidisoli TaxID=1125876 RepID=A0A1I3I1R4_9FLAO|nr:GNAT family N-acetyltransferase [Halpernia frigidisoli]SFI41955.1 Acetyltransferase (GNAT) family protein [Halpernia frigidisoli]
MAEIISFQQKYADDFKKLNIIWLQKFFVVEDYDNEVLSNPQKYILDKGGNIYFAVENEKAIGTFALMYNDYGELEFTKMAVLEAEKGKGFGNLLMQHCIEEAKKMNCENLFLYSNTKLEPANNLYKKFGFTEIPVEKSEYARCNIKMIKHLK